MHLLGGLEFCITYIFNDRNFPQTDGTPKEPYIFCACCDIAISRFNTVALPCRLLIFWCANFVEMHPPKLYGKCTFLQDFHTRKSGEITVFYAINVLEIITS